MRVELRPCGLQGWAVCEGNCEECGTTATTTTDVFWYHGNGKIGGEFHPTKPNDEERYGEYVKVKHGRWILNSQYGTECSECGTAMFEIVGAPYTTFEPNYCPNCGAKMDEVEE